MGWGVFTSVRFRVPAFVAAWTAMAAVGTSGAAFAQTSQVLSAPNTQVTDTMIRNGAYATFNHDGPLLLTRFSSVPDWERRTILAFETTSIPPNSVVSSAILTLTVKSGLGAVGATRPVTAYRLTNGFTETQASWRDRQSQVAWQTPGGDLGESYTTAAVSNVAGTKVNFDVTALVQRTSNGDFGSRQTRLALVDVGVGGDEKESYREYHASESSSVSSRPKLTVVYGPNTGPAVIDVPAGGDLQQALNQVQPGGTVRLASGATFVGNFTLPAKGGSDFVVVTTNAPLPPAGTRIDPSYRAGLATIRSSNESPALATVAGASYYRIVGVAFGANLNGAGDIITLGDHAQTTLAQVPHHLEFDHVLIAGRRRRRAKARHRRERRLHRHQQFGHSRHQGGRPGLTGDCRLEHAWTDHDPKQLSRGGGRERHVRRRTHQYPWCGAERHRGRRQPDDEEPPVARIVVDGQEHLRAEERAPGARSRQHPRAQLGGRADRLRGGVHAAQFERSEPMGGRRRRGVQRQRAAAQLGRLQPARLRQHRPERAARAHPDRRQSGLRHRRAPRWRRVGDLRADWRRAARHHLRSQHGAADRPHHEPVLGQLHQLAVASA